jgi:hypothetical protein
VCVFVHDVARADVTSPRCVLCRSSTQIAIFVVRCRAVPLHPPRYRLPSRSLSPFPHSRRSPYTCRSVDVASSLTASATSFLPASFSLSPRAPPIALSLFASAHTHTLDAAVAQLPLLVVIGWMMDKPLSLDFHIFETATMFISVIIMSILIQKGQSNWLSGLMLLVSYFIVAAGYFVHTGETVDNGGASCCVRCVVRVCMAGPLHPSIPWCVGDLPSLCVARTTRPLLRSRVTCVRVRTCVCVSADADAVSDSVAVAVPCRDGLWSISSH